MASPPGYHRNYKREYQTSLARGERRGHIMRLRARRLEVKRGAVKPHDNKDVDHRVPISKGGSNKTSNFRVESEHKNRSFPRTHRGAIKMADGGLVTNAADALKNREASIDAQIDKAVKGPPPAPAKPAAPAGPSMPVDPLTAQLEAKAKAAKAAPSPPAPSLLDRMKKAIGMEHGGKVPGKGSGDKVPIMGEPGEFMMPKDSVKKIGVAKLEMMRKATHKGAVGRNPDQNLFR